MKKILNHLCGIVAAAGMAWALCVDGPTVGTFAAGAALFLAGLLGLRLLDTPASINQSINKQPNTK